MSHQTVDKDQKKSRFYVSKCLLCLYGNNSEEFMRRDVTQDETWVHHFDTEAKAQSMQLKHPSSPLAKELKEFLQ